MKSLGVLVVMGLLVSGMAQAAYRVVGHTEVGCPLHVKVVHELSSKVDRLLIVADRDVRILKPMPGMSRVKIYRSLKPDQFYTMYEVELMAPEMSRLSELKVFMSGRMYSCLIDV